MDGYRDFQRVVESLHGRFKDQTLWMKLSEIGRYWTAKEMTRITLRGDALELDAPFACKDFTLRIPGRQFTKIALEQSSDTGHDFHSVSTVASLSAGKFAQVDGGSMLCFDLPKGQSKIVLS